MSSSIYPMGFPTKEFGWKGKTFYQVIASIQKNTNNAAKLKPEQLRKPLPLKIYRKEIHNINGKTSLTNCNPRISTTIFNFETPGNTIVSKTKQTYSNGLVNTLDINPTSIAAETGGCNTPSACFSAQFNARKRCRSAGMMPKKFDINKNNDTYNSSTQQYLTSRNRTIKQNEFNYIRKGNSGMIPGPGLAAGNIYSPAGLSHCYQPIISAANNNNVIQYYWINNQLYRATIPDGAYDINSLNAAFQAQQIINKTYIANKTTKAKIFLLSISYDNNRQTAVLTANTAGKNNYPTASFDDPLAFLASVNYPTNAPVAPFTLPTYGASGFVISQTTQFGPLIGFAPGNYYGGASGSSFCGTIFPNYVPLYYKPNNPGFGVQGAVDASTLTNRVRYNTITDAAGGMRAAYGSAAANALAYGVSEHAYTAKDVVGYKNTLTPVINPQTGIICKKKFIYRM